MKYEMLYLIDSSVAEEARDALVAKFEDIVKNLGGTERRFRERARPRRGNYRRRDPQNDHKSTGLREHTG